MPNTLLGKELRRRVALLILPAYLAIVVAAVIGVVAYQHEADQRAQADQDAEVARDQGACEVRNEFRVVIGELIHAAVSAAEPLDLTAPPSFPGTPEWFQTYIGELGAEASAGAEQTDGLAEFAASSLEPENCEAIASP